jgi:TorA-specific chaperone
MFGGEDGCSPPPLPKGEISGVNWRKDWLRMDNSSEGPSKKDLVKVHQFREMFYLFLSRSFSREVDKAFLQSVFEISKSLQDSFKDVEESNLSQGRELLESYLTEIRGADEEVVLNDLARHYAFLFLGVGSENVALCESAYRNERGLLFQNAYFDILEKYRELGLGKREDFSEPEDHLSLELAYMAHLSHRSISSTETGKEEEAKKYHQYQRSFLRDHLLPWIPRFARGLSEISSSKFYEALAYLLEGYIKMDFEFLDSLLPEVSANKASFPGSRRNRKGGRWTKRDLRVKKSMQPYDPVRREVQAWVSQR